MMQFVRQNLETGMMQFVRQKLETGMMELVGQKNSKLEWLSDTV